MCYGVVTCFWQARPESTAEAAGSKRKWYDEQKKKRGEELKRMGLEPDQVQFFPSLSTKALGLMSSGDTLAGTLLDQCLAQVAHNVPGTSVNADVVNSVLSNNMEHVASSELTAILLVTCSNAVALWSVVPSGKMDLLLIVYPVYFQRTLSSLLDNTWSLLAQEHWQSCT